MTFDKLRLSIFEAYQNEEISRDTCQNMLESVMDMEGDHIASEADSVRGNFMGIAMEAAHGGVEFAAFEKEAQSFGDKVKGLWEKFKKWLQGLIESIQKKLGFKKKHHIDINENMLKLCEKVKQVANGITANADPKALIAGALAIVGAGVGVFVGTRKKRVEAGDAQKKLFGGLKDIKKITDFLSGKGGKDGEESGLISSLRKLTKPFSDGLSEISKRVGEIADAAGEFVKDRREAHAAKKAAKKAEGGAEEAETPAEEPAAEEPAEGEQVDQSSATSDFTDGTVFGESADEDFDLDAMLADLGI